MKLFLKMLFGGILLWMTVLTVRTSLTVSLWDAWSSFGTNPWAVATLYDAYFGFLTFYIWVAYKESSLWSRAVWFLLIMGLGNISMSLYMMIQLMRLRRDEHVETTLWRRAR